MKYLKQLMEKNIFTFSDVVSMIGNINNAKTIINNYLLNGYIVKIKHNLYCCVNFENGGIFPNKYKIGSSLTDTSFISLHSAFEFYGCYNQVYNYVSVSSLNKFSDFTFDKEKYVFKKVNNTECVSVSNGVRVSTIERTIVDCVDDNNFDLEELLKCIDLVHYIDIDSIMRYLEVINKKILFKKVGLILELFKDKFFIDETFFEYCRNKGGNVVGKFNNSSKNLQIIKTWGLYISVGYSKLLEK